jgi:hypothetical protein
MRIDGQFCYIADTDVTHTAESEIIFPCIYSDIHHNLKSNF